MTSFTLTMHHNLSVVGVFFFRRSDPTGRAVVAHQTGFTGASRACLADVIFGVSARYSSIVTGWAVAQTCCISQCSKYRKSGIFGYPWEQNP